MRFKIYALKNFLNDLIDKQQPMRQQDLQHNSFFSVSLRGHGTCSRQKCRKLTHSAKLEPTEE